MEAGSGIDFAQIAPYLRHPLVLAGFVLFLLFGVYKTLIGSGLIPTVSKRDGAGLLRRLLDHGFWLALAVVLLGFALAFFNSQQTASLSQDRLAELRQQYEARLREKDQRIDQLRQDGDQQRQAHAAQISAFEALAAQVGKDDSPGAEAALEALAAGDESRAEAIFEEIAARKAREGSDALREAAEAQRHLGALAYYRDTQKAIGHYRKATELHPDNLEGWRQLGRLLAQAGQLDAALGAQQQIIRRSAGDSWERRAALNDRGDLELAKGQIEIAERQYREALRIAERSAARQPGNAERQRDLSVSFIKIGDIRSAQGSLDEALDAFNKDLIIAQRLAEQDPGNAGWQRHLSVSFEKIGDVRSAQGSLDEALDAFNNSLSIIQRLAEQDPGNAGWQSDVAVSHWKLATLLKGMGQTEEAAGLLREGLDVLNQLAAENRLIPRQQGWLAMFEQALAELE